MKRREFFRKSVPVAAAAGVVGGCSQGSGPAIVSSQPNVRWLLASSFPSKLDTIFGASEKLSERVAQLTDGRFKIQVNEPGELVPGDQVYDAVSQGNAEMGHTASYYFKGKHAAYVFDTAVPFGMSARQQSAWLNEAGGRDLLNELFAQKNIITFQGGNTGTQMGGWFRKEVNSVEDLRGLSMRIPGLGGAVMEKLGATASLLQGGEIYTALQTGRLDATEWVGPYDDEKLEFYKVAKFYYYPGFWEPGPGLSFYVNTTAWEKLPDGYKAAVEAATAEASGQMMMEYDAKNPAALKRLLANGVQLRRYPDEILSAAFEAYTEINQDLVDKNPEYKSVFEHWSAFKQASDSWFGTAERAYAEFSYKGA